MREPRQDRSRVTRQRLLDAAIGCLAELGWAGTTVAIVAERAGVSRGAAQHHFATREALVTAVVAHMSDVRAAGIAALPEGERRTESVLEALFGLYSGPVFRAALQLWMAAAADETMLKQIAPLEARLGRQAHHLAVGLLRVDESVPGTREMVQATLDLVRGLGLADLLTDDGARRRRVLKHWGSVLDEVLKPAT